MVMKLQGLPAVKLVTAWGMKGGRGRDEKDLPGVAQGE
jgi:hypothetical protein